MLTDNSPFIRAFLDAGGLLVPLVAVGAEDVVSSRLFMVRLLSSYHTLDGTDKMMGHLLCRVLAVDSVSTFSVLFALHLATSSIT
jgi:hypothetical protein